MTYSEPIPDYSTGDKNLLESSLASTKQTFNKKLLYPTLAKQASILFYSLIKNHPFQNGNKRIAVMAMLAFLGINKKWLTIPPLKLYNIACLVAESKPKEKDNTLKAIEQMVDKFSTELSNSV